MGIATRDQEPSQSLGDVDRPGLGTMTIEMTQRRSHAATALHCSRKLEGTPSGFA